MTSHVARLYTASVAIVVFFLAWVGVAANPWGSTAGDPQLAALAAREQEVRAESLAVQRIVNARWAAYRSELARRHALDAAQAAPPPPVRVVTLPPVTITRSS
jgi:hypothetical protein